MAIGVLSQDKLLTIVNALIAAVRNSEPLRNISKEMTPGVGVTRVTLGLDTPLGGHDQPSCKMSNEGNRDGRLGVQRSQPLKELLAIYAARAAQDDMVSFKGIAR